MEDNKMLAISVGVMTGLAAIIFFISSIITLASSLGMSKLESVAGTSLAEAFYQSVGQQGIGTALALAAMGVLSLVLGLGIYAILKSFNTSMMRENQHHQELIETLGIVGKELLFSLPLVPTLINDGDEN